MSTPLIILLGAIIAAYVIVCFFWLETFCEMTVSSRNEIVSYVTGTFTKIKLTFTIWRIKRSFVYKTRLKTVLEKIAEDRNKGKHYSKYYYNKTCLVDA